MIFNIIGAGRLGKNVALALVKSGQASLGGVCNQNTVRAELAIRQIGCGIAVECLEDLPAANLTFITTPDDSITRIVRDLVKKKSLSFGSLVVHCSGVLNSDILSPLREQGCHIASFHPLKAFRDGAMQADVFNRCDCVLEGDSEALEILIPMVRLLGANPVTINAEKKASYHAAAVMASNYLVTLAANAVELFLQAGMDAVQAKDIVDHLMQGSLDNIRQSPTMASALTGPLMRGDSATISQHLAALENSQTRTLYEAAAYATLSLTNLSDKNKAEITQCFLLPRSDQTPD